MFYFHGYVLCKLNRVKGPNKWGRDKFLFAVSDEGKLYPCAGKDYVLYYDPNTPLESSGSYWKNTNTWNGCDQRLYNTGGCAARIIENGWKMDY